MPLFYKPKYWIVILFMVLLVIVACGRPQEVSMAGNTMGTTYHIKVMAKAFQKTNNLQAKIDDVLDDINHSMSTYLKKSEISRFNDLTTTQKMVVSADFIKVMTTAQKLYHLTDGAWDGTIKPLMDLWGFGDQLKAPQVPPAQQIAAVLDTVGFDKIRVDPKGFLTKARPEVTLDLGSIAKGYGVDRVAALLEKNGFENFIVEIGGEIYAAGTKSNGQSWKAGINRPKAEATIDDVYEIVPLKNQALATSGTYRQFFKFKGRRYAHIIDPRTGYPVQNSIVSVSIMAGNCTLADGLATAVLVMGVEKGLALINRLNGVEGLLITTGPDGVLQQHRSTGLKLMER